MHLPKGKSDSLSSTVFDTDAHIPRLQSLPVRQTHTLASASVREEKVAVARAQVIFPHPYP